MIIPLKLVEYLRVLAFKNAAMHVMMKISIHVLNDKIISD